MPRSGRRQPDPGSLRARVASILFRVIAGKEALGSLSAELTDAAPWSSLNAGLAFHDRELAEIQKLYTDTLTAWRKNPIAKRIVDIITDFTIGDGLTVNAPGQLGQFIDAFIHHPQNHYLNVQMPDLMDELTRAGDLFLALFRNAVDGMSYVRAIPKSEIIKIETAANDWENEIAFYQRNDADEPIQWLSPTHPDAGESDSVMLHYHINRPIGALMGESDLATMIPWLLRYSRMLEDRIRLHWAARAFLWFVKVPSNKVDAKREMYRTPPEAGSIVVHDEAEEWDMQSPSLAAADARHDMRALRLMITTGAGQPPHWHGDAENINRAVAMAMQEPANRHLRRRQLHFAALVRSLCHQAYWRAYAAGKVRRKPDYRAIRVELTDISREDNQSLALAADSVSRAMGQLAATLPNQSQTLTEKILAAVFKFAGEPLDQATIEAILAELPEASGPAGELVSGLVGRKRRMKAEG